MYIAAKLKVPDSVRKWHQLVINVLLPCTCTYRKHPCWYQHSRLWFYYSVSSEYPRCCQNGAYKHSSYLRRYYWQLTKEPDDTSSFHEHRNLFTFTDLAFHWFKCWCGPSTFVSTNEMSESVAGWFFLFGECSNVVKVSVILWPLGYLQFSLLLLCNSKFPYCWLLQLSQKS